MMCKLNKNFYKLKQAGQGSGIKSFNSFIKREDYMKVYSDPCVYFNENFYNFIILLLFVIAMLIVRQNK